MHEKAILPRSQSHYGGKALKTMRFGSLLVDCHDTSAQGNAESAGTGPESTKVLNLKPETQFRRVYKFDILTAIQLCYTAATAVSLRIHSSYSARVSDCEGTEACHR